MPQSGEPFIVKLLRRLAWLAMAGYFVVALSILGLRYLVLPRVDEWRVQIAALASDALDTPVRLGRIEADWQGLHPRLRIEGVRVTDASGREVLSVAQARATLAWRSVLLLSPHLLSLELAGLDVTAARDAQGEFWLAGRKLPLSLPGTQAGRSLSGLLSGPINMPRLLAHSEANAADIPPDTVPGPRATAPPEPADALIDTDSGGAQALRWLLTQRELVLREATVRWHDALAGGPHSGPGEGSEGRPAAAQVEEGLRADLGSGSGSAEGSGEAGDEALVLRDTRLRLRNTLFGSQFALSTRPPAALAGELSVQAELRRHLLHAERTDPRAWSGQVYVQVNALSPAAWLAGWPAGLLAPDLSAVDVRGMLAARAWFDLNRGQLRQVLADVAARGLDWRAENLAVQADTAQARLAGAPTALDLSANLSAAGLRLHLPTVFAAATASVNANANANASPAPSLTLDTLEADLAAQRAASGDWTVQARRLDFANADGAGHFDGVWHSAGRSPAGTLDMQGQLRQVALPAIHRYLPAALAPAVRTWLARALSAGQAEAVAVTLRGDLADFPFAQAGGAPVVAHAEAAAQADEQTGTHAAANRPEPPAPGQFRLAGTFRDAALDYDVLAHNTRQHWPALSQVHGSFEMERATLRLRAQGGQVHTGPQHQVALARTVVDIPLRPKARLSLEGETSGAAPAYLALMAHSPLGEILGHPLDQTQGEGDWRVPLALEVPLGAAASEPVRVRGQIQFANASLSLLPALPRLTQLNGALAFTERGVSTESLRGQWLGGPLQLSGALMPKAPNTANAPSLRATGTLHAQALHAAWPLPSLTRLSGQTSYHADIRLGADGLAVQLESPLTGLALDLPEPLGKPAAPARALTAHWRAGRWLDVSLAERLALRLEMPVNPAAHAPSRVLRASVGLGRPAPDLDRLTGTGLLLDVSWPELDVPAWQTVFEQAAGAQPGEAPAVASPPLLPPLRRATIASARLHLPWLTLTEATLALNAQAEGQASAATWQARLAATQARGQGSWRWPTAKLPGHFSGQFEHLAWAPEERAETTLAAGAPLDLPNLDISVARFSLYGRDLGALKLAGSNLERGRRWQLTELSVVNEDASLHGTGRWRLVDGLLEVPDTVPDLVPTTAPATPDAGSGAGTASEMPEAAPTPQPRGLSLAATLTVQDFGRLLTRLGLPDRVSGAPGTITGRFSWHDLPWQWRDEGLRGQVSVALDKGVLAQTASFGARILELLSLQSVARLSRLDIRPDAVFRDGFRFDGIHAELGVTGSRVHTKNVTVDGAIATILLEGETDWRSERWNLHAAVIPKLDASGAALAAGFVVNPLVGVGALLGQWLLKQPLARAMTKRYTVTGTWSAPEVTAVSNASASDGPRAEP